MNTVKTWLCSLRRLAVVALVGAFLFLSTACSRQDAPLVSTPDSATGTQGQDIELYDAIQSPEGGINTYEDAMPGRPAADTSVKAKALIQNAEQIKDTSKNTVLDAVKEIPESAQELAGDAQRSLSSSAGDLEEAAEDYADRTQRNLERIGDYGSEQVDQAVDNAKAAAEQAKTDVAQQAAELQENVEEVID